MQMVDDGIDSESLVLWLDAVPFQLSSLWCSPLHNFFSFYKYINLVFFPTSLLARHLVKIIHTPVIVICSSVFSWDVLFILFPLLYLLKPSSSYCCIFPSRIIFSSPLSHYFFSLLQYRNFDMDQSGMKQQLKDVHQIVRLVDPELMSYLEARDSANFYFCFRWLLVRFKRELNYASTLR